MRCEMRFLVLMTLFNLFIFPLFAQTIIKGKVLNEKGKPVPFANIYLEDIWDGGSTDENGAYEFSTTHKGAATITVSCIGYTNSQQTITIGNKQLSINLKLKPAATELNAVVISAGAFEASDEKKATILKPLDIVQNPVAAGDLYGALQTLPGVTLVGDETGIFVRGGEAYETKTIIDGTIVQKPFFSEVPDIPSRGRFNPFLFKGTMFSTGGYSAEYGQALSSVLLLNSQDIPSTTSTGLSVSMAGLGLSHTKVWNKKTAFLANVGYTNLNPYFSLIPQNRDWEKAPTGYGGALGFRHKTDKGGMFKTYLQYQDGDMAINLDNLDDPENKNFFTNRNKDLYWNSSYRGILKEKWSLYTAFSINHNNENVNFNSDQFGETTNFIQAKITLGRDLASGIYLKTGAEVYYQAEEYRYNEFKNNLEGALGSAFAELNIKISNKLALRAGGRAEYAELVSAYNFTPRLSLAFKTGNKSQIAFAYGKFFQNPESEFLLENRRLDFESSTHYILNYQWLTDDYTFRIEAYQKNYDQLIKEDDFGNLNNQGDGFSRGIDIFWRDKKLIKGLDYWITYTFIDAERDYRNFPMAATPTFITDHTLNIIGRYSLSSIPLRFGIGYTFASGRPYDDPNDEAFLDKRTKAYHNLNLNASYLTSIFGNFTVIYLSLKNPIGFDQVFGYRYSTDGTISSPVQPTTRRSLFAGLFISFR